MARGRTKLPDGSTWERETWKEVRKRAIASKDPICAICGGEIDMDAPQYHPNSCEVDHIIPVARGGAPYDIDNVQLTHMRCNRQKSTKMAGDYEELKESNLCPLSNNW